MTERWVAPQKNDSAEARRHSNKYNQPTPHMVTPTNGVAVLLYILYKSPK